MNKEVEFKLPKGFSMPEGKGPGDTIDIMCTLQLKDKGTACLTKLGNASMGYGNDEKQETAPDKSEFINSYVNQMNGGGSGGAGAGPMG